MQYFFVLGNPIFPHFRHFLISLMKEKRTCNATAPTIH
ncbi:hypothetical protein T11_11524 [Trichinella zimbabwensis]|uniref:Uncharacterized protein n=1 Tax=Trichinella zimbabwensis TaxID=268475 RepID=A0A0V1DML7_9BILA|nr:hypothetical protein T11_11524 [Trichinella zimbabwensis]